MNLFIFYFLFLLFFSILSIFMGFNFLMKNYSIMLDYEFLSLNSSYFSMSVYLDWMSLFFLGSVLLISSFVIFYSFSYMNLDIYKYRFLYLVLLFILSMMFLIISPNMVSILLGWDGLGLVSYCLVIYYQNYKSYNSGMLTILSNRVGDVAILLSISWLFSMGSWNYIYYLGLLNNKLSFWLIMFIILASFTKSAQIPFCSWLPAAMSAPTPVSSLVHSSTLVTAGVYLLIRFSKLLYLNEKMLSTFLLISCLTMFMSGLAANFEYDLKKIIALSTLSQLGLMMSSLFMGFFVMSYYHLLIHAFFKSLMFLCAGLIIHCMNDNQDIRYMGNLVCCIPLTCSCFCISNLCLSGFPFLSGFYSKDLILESLSYHYYNLFIYILFYVSIGLTISYSFRLIYFCFCGYNGSLMTSIYFEDKFMGLPLFFLSILSIFMGIILFWLIFPFPNFLCLPHILKTLPVFFIFSGSFLGYSLSLIDLYSNIIGINFNYLVKYVSSMWFLPYFSTNFINKMAFYYSKMSVIILDYGWGESLISYSFPSLISYLSSFYTLYQFNNIKFFLIGFMILYFSLFLI
uniref:NADH dehydrogenase subunit 5 n=1 Tax=Gonopsimorpha nigrosignata TaxID=3021792 RepID=UPI0023AB47CB|nr:NADH dehydrogenase subunit 5 [Gonopsimorpha nigrosignata]WCB99309.1 NADH dehydrogenase subunit 5 [Gonopsimorpha nigrosignata]